MLPVPNRFPTVSSPYRIALVGEAPGREETRLNEPFVGASGRFLSALLSRSGTSREACLVANVCQHQPPGNNLASLEWHGDEIQSGVEQLEADLATFNPNIIVTLGGAALHVMRRGNECPPKRKGPEGLQFNWMYSPFNWRGSMFLGRNDITDVFAQEETRKCIATLHPAYVLRDYSTAPLLQFDLKKAVAQACSPKLLLPQRNIALNYSAAELCEKMFEIERDKRPIAIDIEGGIDTMSCISIADAANNAFIVPFFRKDLSSPFSVSDESRIWRSLASLLENPSVPKILQNSLYDRFVLQYSYNIRVQGVHDDTMLAWWELYCELEKNLGVQASICTDEPYYKGERKHQSDDVFFTYCCKDSAVTYEINSLLKRKLSGTSLSHYNLNVAMLNPLLYMELRGIAYNKHGADERRSEIRKTMHETQARLNGFSGAGFTWKSKQDVFDRARALMGFKRAWITTWDELCANTKKAYHEPAKRLQNLMYEPISLANIGEIEDLCEVSLNVNSNELKPFVYEKLGLPVQYDEKKGTPTLDYEALLKLVKHCEREGLTGHRDIIQKAIELRSLDTRQEMLSITSDKDRRIRCGYNIVGTETGRVTCYKSPTGSGYNLQTIPKDDRDLFVADKDHWFFQCDLAGADGWTVAAYSAMLGDRTMLDDYLFGLKPAKILVLSLRGTRVDFTNRDSLKAASKLVSSDDWDYFGMKRVQHGCSYLEGPVRVSNQILSDSEGKFFLEPSECRKLRDHFFFKRYPGILRWHEWMERKIKERPTLIAASGQVRHFFARREEVLPKAIAFEPQANTTYATNLAMYRLWTDPENRKSNVELLSGVQNMVDGCSNHLHIEPLHQVHDALCGQFKRTDTTWATSKIKSWFDNTMIIAGHKITIPFDGGYGENWKQAGSETERVGRI